MHLLKTGFKVDICKRKAIRTLYGQPWPVAVWEREGSIWGTMPKTFCGWKCCAINDGPLSLSLAAFIGLDEKEKKFVNHVHELHVSRVLRFALISVSGLVSVVHHVLS